MSTSTTPPVHKDTPIALLNRLATQGEFQITYNLIAREGYVHAPVFTWQVEVQGLVSEGSGPSKKKAKHLAARSMLIQLLQERPQLIRAHDRPIVQQVIDSTASDVGGGGGEDGANGGDDGTNKQAKQTTNKSPSSITTTTTADSGTGSDGGGILINENENDQQNPIGKLQEITMKKFLEPPNYQEFCEEGLGHDRLFHVQCTIEPMSISVIGVGKSKKASKRDAAAKMLTKLHSEGLDKVDEILDRLPRPYASRATHESLDLLAEIANLRKGGGGGGGGGRVGGGNTSTTSLLSPPLSSSSLITNDDRLINQFYDQLSVNETKMSTLSELFQHSMCSFIYQFMDDTRICAHVEILIQKVAALLDLHLDVVVYHEKRSDGNYQCLAELVTNGVGSDHQRQQQPTLSSTTATPINPPTTTNPPTTRGISIACAYGYDKDIDLVKQKTMTRCLVLLLCNLPLEIVVA